MRKIHRLKLRTEFWDDVISGEKNFEIRINDRGYQRDDQVVFIKLDEKGRELACESEVFRITYVLNGWGIKKDYVVFGLKQITKNLGGIK